MLEFCIAVLRLFDTKMETPKPYGWFHLLWLAVTVAVTVRMCVRYCRCDPEKIRKAVFGTALVVAALEVYKQINYSFHYTDTEITFDYQWYSFPWQFCSMPMYVGLLVGILPEGKVRDGLYAFLASYGVFAGVCVMLYPADVFTATAGINIQTMVCHGSMIVIGVWLLASGHVSGGMESLRKAAPVFIAALSMAVVMNEIAHYTGLTDKETFNMFFVSRHCEPSLPVYSLVQQVVAYPWSLLIYAAVFTLAAGIVLVIGKMIRTACMRKPISV